MKRTVIIFLVLFAGSFTFSQDVSPVKWTYSFSKTSDSTANLYMKATMDEGWHLYSQYNTEPVIPTSFSMVSKAGLFKLIGKVYEPKAIEVFDPNFDMKVKYFSHAVTFTQSIKILSTVPFNVKGSLTFMCCDDKTCKPPLDLDFEFKNIPGYVKAKAEITPDTTVSIAVDSAKVKDSSAVKPTQKTGNNTTEEQSLWLIFLFSLLAGFAAIITPCVFPMIPMTVSFFIKRSEKKAKGIKEAFFYGLSIIVIYVALGLGVSLIFGADALNSMSTNAVFNIFLFLLLTVFAASFFGAFEIQLPSKWVNAMDSRADKSGGYLGVFFMAFTFVLVSFSCTSPIIGTLLVQTAVSKNTLAPFIGMLGFSTALAIPFTLFAIFPSWLNSLPKSGGWLNSVKVTLAFILMAMSLKFLGTASMVNHWGIMDREVFLVIWIVIFTLLGFYLLGKIKFAHDSEVKHVSVTRLFLATISLAFAMYLVPGLWGAPLKAISAFSPPLTTQDFVLSEGGTSETPAVSDGCEGPKKYTDLFKCPEGLNCYFDYDEGMACAGKLGKPVYIDFTGWGCVNCKKMEATVLSDKEVLKKLNRDFVVISLYIDDRTELPESEQYVSDIGGNKSKIKTIGSKNSDFQAKKFGATGAPFYVLLDTKGDTLIAPKAGYDPDAAAFISFLNKGMKAFNKNGDNYSTGF